MMVAKRTRKRCGASSARGFTLVELLVVMLIILLVSAATLPVVLPAIRQRQVSEAGRIFQAALAGARDSAIANNAPRGIRLLPDPVLTQPPVGSYTTDASSNQIYIGGATTWACNRFIPIEPATDYREGRVTFFNPAWGPYQDWSFDPNYSSFATNYAPLVSTTGASVLMLLQSFVDPLDPVDGTQHPVELTSWAWNLRVGDRIQFEPEIAVDTSGTLKKVGGTGHVYTVVGPVAKANPEGFINYGDSGPPMPSNYPPGISPEFLLLVNGVDDDGDGFVDNGFNGTTSVNLYESEKWLGAQVQESANAKILRYVAKRRPVPSRGARETLLPSNVVIDLTTWNRKDGLFPERSRLPVDGYSRYVDIVVDPSGQILQSTSYSTPSSYLSPFLHVWLTDREGVVDPIWGMTKDSNGNPLFPNNPPTVASVTPPYMLPMPVGTSGFTPANNQYLQGERMLISIFAKTGNITINSLQNFDGTDINVPFYAAQRGAKETP